jgi:parvulin-like peptidyl-prolyl isomerase
LAKKKTKKQNKTKFYAGLVLALIILAFLGYTLYGQFQENSKVAAIVNGEVITYAEVEAIYQQLPEEYQGLIDKNEILEQKINEELMLQEIAEKQIEVSDAEIDQVIDSVMLQSGMTQEEFESQLTQQGISKSKLREYYKTQLLILKLLNETILRDVEVTEEEINGYYDESGIEESGIGPEEAREQIEIILISQKREEAFIAYTKELKDKADVQIFFGVDTFTATGEEICKEDDKPIVRLFTTSKCEKCDWITGAFTATVDPYVAADKIVAYHLELDTGDDKLTFNKETSIPKAEAEIFKKYSPSLKVPAFIFGCKYVRIGTGYYEDKDIISEQLEMELIINRLI